MDPGPDLDEIIRVAAKLGMTLGRDEAALYVERVASSLSAIDDFMQARIEEDRPPLFSTKRDRGHRPSASEDPYNAWLWKCEIHGAAQGALQGKTVSFKDHTPVAGLPLTLGSRFLENHIADFDATIVTRVLEAGGTVTGKNSMNGPTSGWGFGVPGDYERPLNPHDPQHVTGASSSGSAAAVAAGEVDISFGGDQGGSIRIPAAFCGTYGLKPTFGLVSHFALGYGSDPSVDYAGPMARHVEEVAAALDAVAGFDSYDPRQDRTVPVRIDTTSLLTAGVDGLRLGILEEGFVGAEPEVHHAVMSAVDKLVGAGARAINVSLPEHRTAGVAARDGLDPEGSRAIFEVGFLGAFGRTYYPASFIASTYTLFHEHTDQLMPRVKLGLIVSEFSRRRYKGAVYAKAQNVRGSFRRAIDAALDKVDVLVMPTCPGVAPRYVEPKSDVETVTRGLTASPPAPVIQNTRPYNYTGHPALSVPCGKSGRLPIGMQLVGRYYDESLLLRTAYAFQHSVDWDQMIGITHPTDRHLVKTSETPLLQTGK